MAKTKSKESTAANRNREKLGQDESFTEIPEIKNKVQDEDILQEDNDLLNKEDEEVEIVMGTEADVTKDDLVLLGDPDADNDLNEDELVLNARVDDIDDEGDPLNESGSGVSGRDLDTPEVEDDDEGSADEENDFYSLGGDEKDDNDNGTPNEYRK